MYDWTRQRRLVGVQIWEDGQLEKRGEKLIRSDRQRDNKCRYNDHHNTSIKNRQSAPIDEAATQQSTDI